MTATPGTFCEAIVTTNKGSANRSRADGELRKVKTGLANSRRTSSKCRHPQRRGDDDPETKATRLRTAGADAARSVDANIEKTMRTVPSCDEASSPKRSSTPASMPDAMDSGMR